MGATPHDALPEAPDPAELAALHQLLDEQAAQLGVAAVRRALGLTPVLSLVRDDAQYHLDSGSGAAAYDGPSGALVLGVPRKKTQPTEVNWLGGKVELKVIV